MCPHPGQPRQPVLQLGQLDLETAFVGLGPAREHIENERRAVDDHHVELLLEVALLARRELAIDHHDVVFETLAEGLDLLQFPLPHVGRRMRMREFLRQ
jgi:hypothetical protein